jgi:hypothetical protein
MNYKEKYFKYKLKYFKLKYFISGGGYISSSNNIDIFTMDDSIRIRDLVQKKITLIGNCI